MDILQPSSTTSRISPSRGQLPAAPCVPVLPSSPAARPLPTPTTNSLPYLRLNLFTILRGEHLDNIPVHPLFPFPRRSRCAYRPHVPAPEAPPRVPRVSLPSLQPGVAPPSLQPPRAPFTAAPPRPLHCSPLAPPSLQPLAPPSLQLPLLHQAQQLLLVDLAHGVAGQRGHPLPALGHLGGGRTAKGR